MNSWANEWAPEYLSADNIKTGESYYHIGSGDEEFMSKNGLLLDNAEKSILRHENCAKEFLIQLKDGRIELCNQTRLLKTLHELYELCRYNHRYQDLMPLFLEAMVYFRDNIDAHFDNFGITTEIDNEYLDMYYGYGGYPAVITSCLSTARSAAVKSMIKTFATHYINPEGYKGDLYGECWIVLTEPRDMDIVEHLPGEYYIYNQRNAIIHTNKDGDYHWRFDFIGLSLFGNRLILDKTALEGATSALSEGLNLKASVYWYLKD